MDIDPDDMNYHSQDSYSESNHSESNHSESNRSESNRSEIEREEIQKRLMLIGGILAVLVALTLVFAVFNVPERLAAFTTNLFGENHEDTIEGYSTETNQNDNTINMATPITKVNNENNEENTTQPQAPEVTDMRISIAGGKFEVDSRNVNITIYAKNAAECHVRNENENWNDWFEFNGTDNEGMTINWTLSAGEGEKTVYLQCRNNDGKLSGLTSDTITYSIPNTEDNDDEDSNHHHHHQTNRDPPSNLLITINSGWPYTNSPNVTLYMHADNADECIIEDDRRGEWEQYTTEKNWTFSNGDGYKIVYYRCRNRYGETGPVTATVILDTVPPNQPHKEGYTATPDEITLNWGADENNLEFVIIRIPGPSYEGGSNEQNDGVYRLPEGMPVNDPNDPRYPPENGSFSTREEIGRTYTHYFTDTQVIPGHVYDYWVIPYDQAFNKGPWTTYTSIHVPESYSPAPYDNDQESTYDNDQESTYDSNYDSSNSVVNDSIQTAPYDQIA